jgi:hypothetical protein
MHSDLFEQAASYLDRGFSIIPISLYTNPKNKTKVVKQPKKEWKKYQSERVSKTVLMTQWGPLLKGGPGSGVAIVTGELSGLNVVDMDDKKAVSMVKDALPEDFKTVTVKTGRGGYHLYFKFRPGLKNTSRLGDNGLDVRTEGGYVVAPPSLFPAEWGSGYQFIEGKSFDQVEVAAMPDKLFELLRGLIEKHEGAGGHGGKREGAGRKDWFLEDLKGVEEGGRTTSLTRLCGNLKRLRVDRESAWNIIQGWNQQNRPPEDPEDLKKQFASIWSNVLKKENSIFLEKINQNHSIVSFGNAIRVMYVGQKGDLFFLTRADFRLKFENQRIPWGKKTRSLAEMWLEWPERKTFEGFVFESEGVKLENGGSNLINGGPEKSEYYNLWRGFAFVPKFGKWNLFRDHIENNIAGKHTEWVLKWMARIIQDPGGQRPGTAIVLRGKQGTGKGIFANSFGRLLGIHYTIVSDLEHVTGRFNKDLAHTILLHVDEATWGGDKRAAGKLKNLITEPRRRVEAKGVDAFYVDNHLNLIISSNNDWVVPAGPMERRFLVLDVSEEFIQNKPYFGAIVSQLGDGGYEAMMYDLASMAYDLDELRQIPITEATISQTVEGLDTVEAFWYERLNEGRLVDNHDFWKYRVVVGKIYQQYVQYCTIRHLNRKIRSNKVFSKMLRKVCPQIETRVIRDGLRATFRCLIVPDLDICRAEFEKFVSGKEVVGEWPEVAEPENVTIEQRHKDLPGGFSRG